MNEKSSQDTFLEFFRPQFFQEAEELLEAAESLILELEKSGDWNRGLEQLFRIFHTIKGNAGMAQEDGIQQLCHIFEDQLDELRHQKNAVQEIPHSFAEETLKVVDLLRYAVSNQNPPEIEEMLRGELYRLQMQRSSLTSPPFTGPQVQDSGSEATATDNGEKALPEFEAGISEKKLIARAQYEKQKNFSAWLADFRKVYREFSRMNQLLDGGASIKHLNEINLSQDVFGLGEKGASAVSALRALVSLAQRNQVNMNNDDTEDLKNLFAICAERLIRDLVDKGYCSYLPISKLRDFKSFSRLYHLKEPIIFVYVGIPYERLLIDAKAFDVMQRIRSDKSRWVAFIYPRDSRVGKAAAFLEWGLGDNAKVFYDVFHAASILSEDREFTYYT